MKFNESAESSTRRRNHLGDEFREAYGDLWYDEDGSYEAEYLCSVKYLVSPVWRC
jgi:hypothetical protein